MKADKNFYGKNFLKITVLNKFQTEKREIESSLTVPLNIIPVLDIPILNETGKITHLGKFFI